MTQTIDYMSAAICFASGGDIEPESVPGYAANSRMYLNLSSAEYHADRDALSCSTLKPLLVSPAHFQASLLEVSGGSKAMDFGTLVHGLVLQPQLVGQEFALYPGAADARSKDYKQFLESNPMRLVVDEPTFSKARTMAEKVLYRKIRGRPFGDFLAEGEPEVSIYFEEPTTGIMLKIRPDLKHPDFTFDLKSTRHATSHAFIRDGLDLGYDLQAFMYSLGRSLFDGTETPKPFVFVAAESDAPFSVNDVLAGSSFLSNGAKKFQEALTVYAACQEAGYWPDAGGETVAEIEHWQQFSPRSNWRDLLGKIA